MKYLKRYKLFENKEELIEDIKDIIIDLEDLGNVFVKIDFSHLNGYICFEPTNPILPTGGYRYITFNEIEDYFIRLVGFLGDKVINISYLEWTSPRSFINGKRITLDGNDFSELKNKNLNNISIKIIL
jgi:hypothetical protein